MRHVRWQRDDRARREAGQGAGDSIRRGVPDLRRPRRRCGAAYARSDDSCGRDRRHAVTIEGAGWTRAAPDQNGDLFLTIRIEPNPVFALTGRDLRVSLPVWDYEAALGAEITAPTVDGRVSLKIPPGSQTGRVMRLRGRGLPARGKEPAGDLLYELKVLAPTDLNAKERALMQDLATSLKDRGIADPRAELTASKN